MLKRIMYGFSVLALCIVVLSACNSGSDNKVVATVNGTEIPREDYEQLLNSIKESYAAQGMDTESLDEDSLKELETMAIDQLVNTQLLLQTAQKAGTTVEDAKVEEQFTSMKSNFKDDKAYEEALKKNNMTEEELKIRLKEELMITTYLDKEIGEVEVTDEDIQKLYDEYKSSAVTMQMEVEPLENIKDVLEQQAVSQKKQEKVTAIIEKLREENEIKINL